MGDVTIAAIVLAPQPIVADDQELEVQKDVMAKM